MITLLGVGHVFDIRERVRREILARGPAVVGLELDQARFYALTHRDEAREAPLFYRLLGGFQDRVAEEYGGRAGDEMLAAAQAAREIGAGIAFVDMDSRVLWGRLWRSIPFEERVKLVVSALSALFIRKKTVEKEMAKYEADRGAYLEEFARHFPTVRRILIDERDAHMAGAIRALAERHGRVVAVIGDGHVDGIRAHLDDLAPEMLRLGDLRAPAAPPASEFTYSFTARG